MSDDVNPQTFFRCHTCGYGTVRVEWAEKHEHLYEGHDVFEHETREPTHV